MNNNSWFKLAAVSLSGIVISFSILWGIQQLDQSRYYNGYNTQQGGMNNQGNMNMQGSMNVQSGMNGQQMQGDMNMQQSQGSMNSQQSQGGGMMKSMMGM